MPDPSAASVATGCCTDARVKILFSLLLVLTRLQLPLAGVVRSSGVELGASLLRRLGGGVLKPLLLSAPAAVLGLLPPTPSMLDLRRDAAADLAEGLSMLALRPLLLLLPLLCVLWASGRKRTSPLRLSAAGPDTGSRSLHT